MKISNVMVVNIVFSINTEEHKPIAVGMVIVDKYGEIVKEYYYSGEKSG